MVLENQANGHESKFIKKVVKVIEGRLSRPQLSVAPLVIGIHSQVEKLNLWVRDGSTDVGILAICGMRGIGKTTMAKLVYNLNCERFEGSSFLENMKKLLEQPNGLVQMQMQLLSDVSNGKKKKIHNFSEGMNKIQDAIRSKKILLVLDDVDHIDQLDPILRMRDQFYPGSKVIITTSHVGLLKAQHQVMKVHEVKAFGHSEAMELFSRHAFGQDHPLEGYMEQAKRVVDHCAGLPLALKILGSFLSGQSIIVWRDALDKLEAIPNYDILKKLKISYDSLQDDHDRNLFLHIACFFVGKDKSDIVEILDGCGLYSVVGIQNLTDRCLVRIDRYNKVQMHDMIRDMGRGIVRLESEEPGERSRLWNHHDSFDVLTEKTGTERIKGLILDMQRHSAYSTGSRSSDEVVLETKAFSRMLNIRLLQLSRVRLKGGYEEFPRGLRWLCWQDCPLDSLPSDFPLRSLVILEICHGSSLRQVWKGTNKYLPSLKVLNLSHSHGLTETPNFSAVPNLQRLILKDCPSLVEVHESIGSLWRLNYLDLEDCKKIRKLPKSFGMLTMLETLKISGCSNLDELPIEMRKIESLEVFHADGISIHRLFTREVKSWPRKFPDNCWASYLPRNLVGLILEDGNLSDDDFPTDFCLPSLVYLDLSGNPISCLPNCIRGLVSLEDLYFDRCKKLTSLERLPRIGEVLAVRGNELLERVTFQSSVSHIPETVLSNGNSKLVEFEYWFKLEPIERVDIEMINLLGLSNLDSIKSDLIDFRPSRGILLPSIYHGPPFSCRPYRDVIGVRLTNVQGLYEYGIFSTFLPDYGVPVGFNHKARGSSVSFTVPLLPNIRIRGFNFFSFYVMGNRKASHWSHDFPSPIVIVVSNESKNLKWIYCPSYVGVPPNAREENFSITWLSHWKFGNQLIEAGDEVVLSVVSSAFLTKWCGIQIVYEQDEDINMQRSTTDVPCYLRGISDVDLSRYEVIPGTYILEVPSVEFESDDGLSWLSKLMTVFDRQNRQRRHPRKQIPDAYYRVNVSAYRSFNAKGCGGLGVVIRKPSGEVMACYWRKYHGPLSREAIALPAMVMGLQLALDEGFEAVVLESDDLEAVECVLADDKRYFKSELDGHLLEEVRSFLEIFSFGVCRYQYSVAPYWLAQEATSDESSEESCSFVGLEEIPWWLSPDIEKDDSLLAHSDDESNRPFSEYENLHQIHGMGWRSFNLLLHWR